MSGLPNATAYRSRTSRPNRVVDRLKRSWLLLISLIICVYVGLPWAAPVLMELGWTSAGKAIYLLYAFLCHQLPQRSLFLFGNQQMYSLAEIQTAWQYTNDPLVLRQYIGESGIGWKVAWSDRMVYMYTPILLWGALFWLFRKRIKSLPWFGLALFLLPMAIDGSTHAISDFSAGIGLGFRDSNAWLAALTGNAFPATFYAGDGLGTFNSWLRLITGLLFSLGIVWALYPRLHNSSTNTANQINEKFPEVGLET